MNRDPNKPLPKSAIRGIEIKNGAHGDRSNGLCVMEVVAWVAGLPHSDAPECACPVASAYARRLNDARWSSNEARTKAMRPLVIKLLGSKASPQTQAKRYWFLTDRAARLFAPLALEHGAARLEALKRFEAAKTLREYAAKLRAMPELHDRESAASARELLQAARRAAAAAYAYDAAAAAYADAYAAYADAAAYAYDADAAAAAYMEIGRASCRERV